MRMSLVPINCATQGFMRFALIFGEVVNYLSAQSINQTFQQFQWALL
jgi:hypothetical protein